MHRWFFAIEREECVPKPKQDDIFGDIDAEQGNVEVEITYTDWPFCVTIGKQLMGNEYVAITGNCDELGNWDPKKVIMMERTTWQGKTNCGCNSFKYVATIRIPRNIDIEYRYCVVAHDPILDDNMLRFSEVHLKPRIIRTCQNMLQACDEFGLYDEPMAEYKIDRGWITTETYIQFKVFNAPFVWLKQSPRLLYLYIQPMYETEVAVCSYNYQESTRLTTISLHPKGSIEDTQDNVRLAFTEVTNLTFAKPLHYQPRSGARCGPTDLQLYHCSIRHPELTLYRLDLHTFARKAGCDEPPYHYGYGFIRPEQLVNSEGQLRIKITCSSTHRPLIELNIQYLIIRPLPTVTCNLSAPSARQWNPQQKVMDIGHRGTGNTYRFKDDVHRENTVYGFKKAQKNFADMVEFDVQLTKDAQVFVYHDFALKFVQNCNRSVDQLLETQDVFVFPHEQINRLKLLAIGGAKRDEYLVVPCEAFLYEELRLARALQFTASDGCNINCDQLLFDQQPFPLLSDLFDIDKSGLTEKLGFNIEIKWPQQDSDRHWEGNKPSFDRNFYVDTILELVFKLAGNRRIIFSSFDPDICQMVRYKQNRFPIMLVCVDLDKPFRFFDQRIQLIENATYFSYNMELFGLNLHSSIILNQPLIMNMIRDLRMQIATWGRPNNDSAFRDKLKRFGIIGIIFDRINQINQQGEELHGNICCIDSLATRGFIRQLEFEERLRKCSPGMA